MRAWAAYGGSNSGMSSERFLDDFNTTLTKREIQERKQELHRQKEEYERNNRTFMSEERKKALWK